MKKVLLLLYITLSLNGFSQTDFRFADSSAQWSVLELSVHLSSGVSTYVTEKISVTGEQTFGNKQYQIISNAGTGTNQLVRLDSFQKVWTVFQWDTTERLYYDFSLQVNDTVRVFDPYVTHSYSFVCKVDSINSVFWLSNRKRMFLSCGRSLNMLFRKDIWVEGIGSLLVTALNPGSDTMTFSPNLLWLESVLCFQEQNILLYQKQGFSSCDEDSIWMGISEIRNPQSAIRISPNPATTYLTIQLQQNPSSPTVFQLYDVTGRMILQKPLTAQINHVELSGVSKGMYLYSVLRDVMVSLSNHQHDMQRVGAGKVVVE